MNNQNYVKAAYELNKKIREGAVMTQGDLSTAANIARTTGSLEYRVIYVNVKAMLNAQNEREAE